jgi:ELWxxDGT repeat protein
VPDFRFAKLAVIGEKILFVATGGAAIGPLWVSDGTEAGTQQLKDKGVVEFYAATPSHVFFTLDDPATGAELWTTDGTSAGTHIVLDANAGSGSSEIRVATVFGERLAFHAFHKDPVGGQSDYVYVTSGAAGDAVPVTPSSGKGASPFFVNGVAFGDRALFTFATEAEGEELWLTDGTSSGTRMVKDTWPGTTPGYPSAMTVVGTKAFFFAYDGSNDSKFLWETDGTTGGTKIVAQVGLAANHVRMTPKGGKLYFSGRQAKAGSPPDAAFDGLWETDGTTAGTRLISNAVLPTPWSVPGPGQEPNFTMVVVGDKLVFFGSSPDGGTEPWVSDGTSAGTMRLQDVYPGKPGCTNPSSGLVTLGTKAYFVPVVATSDYRLFETDGTTAGTHAIAPPGASADSKNTVFEEPVRMGTILLFGGAFDARGAELYKL